MLYCLPLDNFSPFVHLYSLLIPCPILLSTIVAPAVPSPLVLADTCHGWSLPFIVEAHDRPGTTVAPAMSVAVSHDQRWISARDILIRVSGVACCGGVGVVNSLWRCERGCNEEGKGG